MIGAFHKFPSIHHFAWLGSDMPRSDKVLTLPARLEFLKKPLLVEEKLDGANLGISFDVSGNLQIQNRGSFLVPEYSGQFRTLSGWLRQHKDNLFDALTDRLQLFGEWCAITHSVHYINLPDWFIAFDIFDLRAERFWSASRRNQLLSRLGISVAPKLAQGIFTLPEITTMLNSQDSAFGAAHLEGVMMRCDSSDWLLDRAKLVRAEFAKDITTHWRRTVPQANRLHRSA